MIDFQPEDRTQQRLVGGIATLIYAVSVLLLLLLLKFQLLPPPDNGEGLMINFGNVEEAAPRLRSNRSNRLRRSKLPRTSS